MTGNQTLWRLCCVVVLGLSGMAEAAFEGFTGYDTGSGGNGSTFTNNGGSTTGSIAWTGAWGEAGSNQSAAVLDFNLGTVNTVTSVNPTAEFEVGGNTLESIRGFDAQANQSAVYVSTLIALGKDGGADTTNSFGGIGLFEGGTEKFLIGQRFGATNWGATASGDLGGDGNDSSVAIGNFSTALLVAKVDQVSNQLTFWVNPDFAQAEGDNVAAFTLSWDGSDDDDIDTLRLRGGDANTGNKWQFDNVEVTLASPFFVIPSPTALPAGLMLLTLAGMRRRRS